MKSASPCVGMNLRGEAIVEGRTDNAARHSGMSRLPASCHLIGEEETYTPLHIMDKEMMEKQEYITPGVSCVSHIEQSAVGCWGWNVRCTESTSFFRCRLYLISEKCGLSSSRDSSTGAISDNCCWNDMTWCSVVSDVNYVTIARRWDHVMCSNVGGSFCAPFLTSEKKKKEGKKHERVRLVGRFSSA